MKEIKDKKRSVQSVIRVSKSKDLYIQENNLIYACWTAYQTYVYPMLNFKMYFIWNSWQLIQLMINCLLFMAMFIFYVTTCSLYI